MSSRKGSMFKARLDRGFEVSSSGRELERNDL